jgi:signal recognition particle subunit SEC65
MSVLFYREERDADFFNACETVRAGKHHLSVTEIAGEAIRMPAKSFYLHPREYSNIIRSRGRKLPQNSIKRELHNEILRIFKELSFRSVSSAVKIISCQPAPRFYISESRASALYYRLLKKRRTNPTA